MYARQDMLVYSILVEYIYPLTMPYWFSIWDLYILVQLLCLAEGEVYGSLAAQDMEEIEPAYLVLPCQF